MGIQALIGGVPRVDLIRPLEIIPAVAGLEPAVADCR